MKSCKFHLAFANFVPRDRPASRGCTLRPSQRPLSLGAGVPPISGHSLRICSPLNCIGLKDLDIILDRLRRSGALDRAVRFYWDNLNESARRSESVRARRPRLRRFRLTSGLQGSYSGRDRSPNHSPDVVVACDQPRLMSPRTLRYPSQLCAFASLVAVLLPAHKCLIRLQHSHLAGLL